MTEIEIKIDKQDVYEEVAQTSSYTGAKMTGDDSAYDRIFTTEADRSQLERFWSEASADLCEALKAFVSSEDSQPDSFTVTLSLSASFDPALIPAMKREAFSFFVNSITGKWYGFTNKAEAASYAAAAASMLDAIRRKAHFRRKPSRPHGRALS